MLLLSLEICSPKYRTRYDRYFALSLLSSSGVLHEQASGLQKLEKCCAR